MPAPRAHFLDCMHDVHAPRDFAEHDMLAIQPRGLCRRDEELGALRVLTAVRHGQQARLCVVDHTLLPLVGEHPAVDALASTAVATCQVATLAHEAGDYPMQCGALEVQRLAGLPDPLLACRKSSEVLCGSRHHRLEQLELNAPDGIAAHLHVEVYVGVALAGGVLGSHRRTSRCGRGPREVKVRDHGHAEQDDGSDQGHHATLPKGRLLGVDVEELQLEDQDGPSGDRSGAPLAVAEVARQDDLPTVALAHQLERLSPTGHDLVRSQDDWRAPAVGGVELRPVCQDSPVMYPAWRREAWLLAGGGAAAPHLVLKARRQLHDIVPLRAL
mmetsp:Transcript_42760/g.120838  ORF Transcript_42760/g.120838 Transcript_42760/m.120838 type:complete len:329 (-) Transcript_42760:175-1161(-)